MTSVAGGDLRQLVRQPPMLLRSIEGRISVKASIPGNAYVFMCRSRLYHVYSLDGIALARTPALCKEVVCHRIMLSLATATAVMGEFSMGTCVGQDDTELCATLYANRVSYASASPSTAKRPLCLMLTVLPRVLAAGFAGLSCFRVPAFLFLFGNSCRKPSSSVCTHALHMLSGRDTGPGWDTYAWKRELDNRSTLTGIQSDRNNTWDKH